MGMAETDGPLGFWFAHARAVAPIDTLDLQQFSGGGGNPGRPDRFGQCAYLDREPRERVATQKRVEPWFHTGFGVDSGAGAPRPTAIVELGWALSRHYAHPVTELGPRCRSGSPSRLSSRTPNSGFRETARSLEDLNAGPPCAAPWTTSKCTVRPSSLYRIRLAVQQEIQGRSLPANRLRHYGASRVSRAGYVNYLN